jgi:RNA 2',3'-cyclic 3'-phosphodiesterase
LRLRLFFALWPDDAVRRALAEAARPMLAACRGRPVATRNYHLTLAFLGGVPAARLEEICAAAARVRAAPFELRLDRHGHWPGPRVAWLGGRMTPPAAEALAAALWAALMPLGFKPDPRPFRVHLTVLRACRGCDWDGELVPVDWPVREFVLAKSETLDSGPRYEVLARWRLADALGDGS